MDIKEQISFCDDNNNSIHWSLN